MESRDVVGPQRAIPVGAEAIDFEGFLPGTIVSTVFGSSGSGPIAVHGTNPILPGGGTPLSFSTRPIRPAATSISARRTKRAAAPVSAATSVPAPRTKIALPSATL